jgi:hypothetical protein
MHAHSWYDSVTCTVVLHPASLTCKESCDHLTGGRHQCYSINDHRSPVHELVNFRAHRGLISSAAPHAAAMAAPTVSQQAEETATFALLQLKQCSHLSSQHFRYPVKSDDSKPQLKDWFQVRSSVPGFQKMAVDESVAESGRMSALATRWAC